VNAHRWTPEHRDALLARVGRVTAGTAVVSCLGAVGLAVGLGATAQAATTSAKAAGPTAGTVPARGTAGSAGSGSDARGSAVLAPSSVRVEVLNGVGIAGAARLVADQLRQAGFDVVATGNTQGRVAASGIIYAPGQAAAYRLLSDVTGVTLSSGRGTGSTLIVVVGPDWPGELPAAPVAQGSGNLAGPPSAPQSRNGGGTTTSGGS
jgi:hypothetical protein